MAAWHCRACNLNYPMTWEPETPCPGCDGRLDYGTHWTPTPNWQKVSERRRAGEITLDGEPVEITGEPPASSIRTRYDVATDMFWVRHEELAKAGYEVYTLENFHVVELNGKFWELQGYSRNQKEWWVERIYPEDDLAYLDDLPSTPPGDLSGEVIDTDDGWIVWRADNG